MVYYIIANLIWFLGGIFVGIMIVGITKMAGDLFITKEDGVDYMFLGLSKTPMDVEKHKYVLLKVKRIAPKK